MNNILAVKIIDNNTGLFRKTPGKFSKNGKTFSTLAFAKTSITNEVDGIHSLNFLEKYLYYDFIISKIDGTIEKIPVKTHIIDLYERRLEEVKKIKEQHMQYSYAVEFENSQIKYYEEAIKYLSR